MTSDRRRCSNRILVAGFSKQNLIRRAFKTHPRRRAPMRKNDRKVCKKATPGTAGCGVAGGGGRAVPGVARKSRSSKPQVCSRRGSSEAIWYCGLRGNTRRSSNSLTIWSGGQDERGGRSERATSIRAEGPRVLARGKNRGRAAETRKQIWAETVSCPFEHPREVPIASGGKEWVGVSRVQLSGCGLNRSSAHYAATIECRPRRKHEKLCEVIS